MRKKPLILYFLFILLTAIYGYFRFENWLTVPQPFGTLPDTTGYTLVHHNAEYRSCGNNYIRKNDHGHWEMYVEGDAFSRGFVMGKLSHDLIRFQEEAFVKQIREMIPSEGFQRFLNLFISTFNKNLYKHIPQENREEIFGISLAADSRYDFIGPAYARMMNYHAAHDIGHMLQQYHLAGCTSFAAWNGVSSDSLLIAGRNFDFYFGDDFSREKIILFMKPDSGNAFAMVSWGGMTGAVSGMNIKGLSVTINAARSDVPVSTGTPVTILARRILQYASDIPEAIRIANSYSTFVSESFMIGSAHDNSAVIIEKTPYFTTVRRADSKLPRLCCTNHFESLELTWNELNQKQISETATFYRGLRLNELIKAYSPLDPQKSANILRDDRGLGGADIGTGNEKAINQYIAHHSVIFKPAELKMWVSTDPWQCGNYVCYDLGRIFSVPSTPDSAISRSGEIKASLFMSDGRYHKLLAYRAKLKSIHIGISNNLNISKSDIKELINLNPMYFEAWETAGDAYVSLKMEKEAADHYKHALSLVIPATDISHRIEVKLHKILKTPVPTKGHHHTH
jgi:hypothetical protein